MRTYTPPKLQPYPHMHTYLVPLPSPTLYIRNMPTNPIPHTSNLSPSPTKLRQHTSPTTITLMIHTISSIQKKKKKHAPPTHQQLFFTLHNQHVDYSTLDPHTATIKTPLSHRNLSHSNPWSSNCKHPIPSPTHMNLLITIPQSKLTSCFGCYVCISPHPQARRTPPWHPNHMATKQNSRLNSQEEDNSSPLGFFWRNLQQILQATYIVMELGLAINPYTMDGAPS